MSNQSILQNKPTFVLGASDNPERTSYTALHMLTDAGVPVYAFGLREAEVAGVKIQKDLSKLEVPQIHTVTLYMGAARQEPFVDFILALNPKRVIFNPGAENPVLYQKAQAQGIECLEACTLVMLNFGRF